MKELIFSNDGIDNAGMLELGFVHIQAMGFTEITINSKDISVSVNKVFFLLFMKF